MQKNCIPVSRLMHRTVDWKLPNLLKVCTYIFSSLSRLHRFINRCIWRWQISLALQLMIPHAGLPRGRGRPRHCGWCGGHIRGHAENKTQATLGEYKYIYQGQKKARVEGQPASGRKARDIIVIMWVTKQNCGNSTNFSLKIVLS